MLFNVTFELKEQSREFSLDLFSLKRNTVIMQIFHYQTPPYSLNVEKNLKNDSLFFLILMIK